MGTEQQAAGNEQGSGAAGGAGAGGSGGEAARPAAQVFGTASRAPLFTQQQPEGTQEQQQPGAAPAGGEQPKPGRGPVSSAVLPPEALKVRLDRARAQGQEAFFKELGVKTEAEAKDKLAKLKTAEADAEKRRLAEMSENERLKAELEAARQENESLRQQLATHAQEREHEQHEQSVSRVATEMIDPDALPLFKVHLAQHVKKLAASNPELAEKFSERGIKRFAEKWAKDHPKFAKQATSTTTTETPPAKPAPAAGARPAAGQGAPVVRRPVTTGVPPRKPPAQPVNTGPAAPAMMNGKTARPGQQNSMNSAEVKAFAAKHGVNYTPL